MEELEIHGAGLAGHRRPDDVLTYKGLTVAVIIGVVIGFIFGKLV